MAADRPDSGKTTSEWSRREVLRATGIASAAALLPGSTACGGRSSNHGPRRVLLITGDDLGWKDLSSSGNPNLHTPNLDRLRSDGVYFTHAFDVTSTCSSSRTTFATGQYPHTHGVTGLVHRNPELSLAPNTPTLASRIRDIGMKTAIEGKFHLAFPDTADHYGYEDVMTTFATQWIIDSSTTIDFIDRSTKARWFFEVNYMNPHRNLVGDFELHENHPIDPNAIEIPEYIQLPNVSGAREELAAYYSQVQRMDEMIGEVLAALESRSLLDDTLIVFISDNGCPFPGNKLTLFDRGTGTPLIFHWPAGLPRGLERDDLVSSIDLMPTILDIVGAAIPPEVEGTSLLPLLVDASAKEARGNVYSEMTTHISAPFPMRSVRDATHRYIRNYSDHPIPIEGRDQPWVEEVLADGLNGFDWDAPRVPEELYDLRVDPQEQNNLAGDPSSQSVLEDMRAKLDEHMQATSDDLLGSAFETTQ